MSDKLQFTALRTQEKMKQRYGNIHHKHNKCHMTFRLHKPTHPALPSDGMNKSKNINTSTEHFPIAKLRNVRRRLAYLRYH